MSLSRFLSRCALPLLAASLTLISAQGQQPAPAPAPIPAPAPSTNSASAPAQDAASTAKSYVNFGVERGKGGDLAGAIAAFDQAIKLDPKNASAYVNRGIARTLQHDLPSAITDFDTAIQIDGKNELAYYHRGVAKGELGDFDGAIADSSHVIELNPKMATAFYNRGHARYFKGDLDGALTDVNSAIDLAPDFPYSYYIRGLIRHTQKDRVGAVSDFQKSATSGFPFGGFWLWIIKTEAGDRGVARATLSDLLLKPDLFKPNDWPTSIANFLLGKAPQDDLMTAAKAGGEDKDRLCQAWFYAGMSKHFNGDSKGAIECFQEAVKTGASDAEEFIESQRQIAAAQPVP